MRHASWRALLCSIALSTIVVRADAQSLAKRVTSSDGSVQVIYDSRPSACGDGENYIGNVFGKSAYYTEYSTYKNGDWRSRPCVHGPARVVATVVSGEVTRLRPYVGPPPRSDMRTLNASSADASAWLNELIDHGSSKLASEAMLPLMLVDAPDPWPALLRVARDDSRPKAVRSAALTWLSNGVNEKLGIADAASETDDDEMKAQAVFALSQQRSRERVDDLIDIARNAKAPAARRSAIFWLGQTGDPRVADVYAEFLKLR